MQEHVIYKLEHNGIAYNAVQSVHQSVVQMARDFERAAQKPTRKSIETELVKRISDSELIEHSGLSSPVIEVNEKIQNYPRAYNVVPQVYQTNYKYKDATDNSPDGKPELYMFCPIGHDGDHFVPQDARLIDDEKEEKFIGGVLFAGGWNTPSSYFTLNKRGVDVPNDYDPPEENTEHFYTSHLSQCFIAQGLTLDFIEDYNERSEKHDASVKNVVDELQRITSEELQEQFNVQIPQGEGYYMNSSVHSNAPNEYHISIRRNGDIDAMSAGQPLEIKSNNFFIAEETNSSEYRVIANTATNEGKKLNTLLNSVPEKPSLAEYPDLVGDMPFKENEFDSLLGVNGNIPSLDTFEGHFLLRYNTDDITNTEFCPPDAVPVPSEVFHWLRADREDRQMGVTPPPQPEALKDDIRALASVIDRDNFDDLYLQSDDHNNYPGL